jgi:hypothetical protein
MYIGLFVEYLHTNPEFFIQKIPQKTDLILLVSYLTNIINYLVHAENSECAVKIPEQWSSH